MSLFLIIAVLIVVAVGVVGCLAMAGALVCWFIRDLRKDREDPPAVPPYYRRD